MQPEKRSPAKRMVRCFVVNFLPEDGNQLHGLSQSLNLPCDSGFNMRAVSKWAKFHSSLQRHDPFAGLVQTLPYRGISAGCFENGVEGLRDEWRRLGEEK